MKRQAGSYLEHQQRGGYVAVALFGKLTRQAAARRFGSLATTLAGDVWQPPPSSTSTTLYVIFKVIRGEP